MVGIIHCGTGNIASVANALDHLGGEVRIVLKPDELGDYERLVLPGVGSFFGAMKTLRDSGFEAALQVEVMGRKKPVLGICLGMQVMAGLGTEGGESAGLGWFPGAVRKLAATNSADRIPHVGWNQIQVCQSHALLAGVPSGADFYFVHSYTMRAESDVVATCDYADGVTAIVARDNIFATQFHPEKSQDHGLKILENFLDWNP